MVKSVKGVLLEMVFLNRSSKTPLYLQLDAQIRAAVLSGVLVKGDRLPATRQLAKDLDVSRITIQITYDQLIAEGFLTALTGSGTFVAEIPSDVLPSTPNVRQSSPMPEARLSSRGQAIAQTSAMTRIGMSRPFRPGVPATDLFPLRAWSKLWSRSLAGLNNTHFGYGPSGGHPPLRKAIATYLGNARGIKCDPDQVIVTGGAQQAFALSALALLDPGDIAWGEYPGHTAGRDVLKALGAKTFSVPVDNEGLDLDKGRAAFEIPKLIFVTPSHQHPLGITMSLRRRLELLRYAEDVGSWILEDDYDSVFRYSGRPLPALQGLDRAARVIYAGSFSKVIYPSLRLGYVVVPPDMIDAYTAAQTVLTHGVSLLPQIVVAEFMESGGFATHIRKMRVAYAERRLQLLSCLHEYASEHLEVPPSEAGMHLMAWLKNRKLTDLGVSQQLWAAGIEVVPLSIYCDRPYHRQGLLLGFTGVRHDEMASNVKKLVAVLETSKNSR